MSEQARVTIWRVSQGVLEIHVPPIFMDSARIMPWSNERDEQAKALGVRLAEAVSLDVWVVTHIGYHQTFGLVIRLTTVPTC